MISPFLSWLARVILLSLTQILHQYPYAVCKNFRTFHLVTKIFKKWVLVAQMVKNLLAMWETWVWSVGWEDPLEEGMATYSNILAWRIPMDRGTWQATVHGLQRVGHD